eukprot:2859175-Rhodomonas_salina.2
MSSPPCRGRLAFVGPLGLTPLLGGFAAVTRQQHLCFISLTAESSRGDSKPAYSFPSTLD